MKVKYCCNPKDYENYYVTQVGKGMPYYSGRQFQRGCGLCGLFSSIGRAVLPMIKSGIKTVGKEVQRSGAELASDALQGKNLKSGDPSSQTKWRQPPETHSRCYTTWGARSASIET